MNYRSLSLRDKHIHINKTVHKIFWEAGNRCNRQDRPSNVSESRLTHWNCLMKPIASIMRSWKSSKSLSSVMFFRKGQKRKRVLIPGFDLSLSEMRTRPCHDWNEAQQQFYPWTFVGRDAHRIKYTVHTSFSYFAKKYQHNVTKCISTDG